MITFPDAVGQLDEMVAIKSSKPLGVTAGIYVQEAARQIPLYDQPISANAAGKDADGKSIEVNTVGRWLFGVPGYEGHVRIAAIGNNVSFHFPKESPKEIHELVSLIKQAVEAAR